MTYRILGLVLAGGLSSRMGFDKAQIQFGQKTLLEQAIEQLKPFTSAIIISNNKPAELKLNNPLPIIADLAEFAQIGPLGGILSGLNYATNHGFDAVLTIPIDTPFLTDEIFTKMLVNLTKDNAFRLASTEDGLQSTIGLWPTQLTLALKNHLINSENKSIRYFANQNQVTLFHFSEPHLTKAFTNINTPEDLNAAKSQLFD